MMPKTSAASAAAESSVPTGSSRGGRVSRVGGTIASVPASATAASTTLRPKIDGQGSHSSRTPEASRPSTPPPAATPTHVPTALPRSSGGKTVVITDSVTGMIERRADAHHDAQPDQLAGAVREDRRQRREAEEAEPEGQDRLAAEAVADRAGGKEQRRERERVRVDDPLQLRLRGAGVPRDLGQRHVQAGDGGDHHHQREAHDPEHRPALLSFVLNELLAVHHVPPFSNINAC